MGKIKILNPGFFTTVQDEGRMGYRALGISPCGAMDKFAYSLSNYLVGNTDNCASLELTMLGPKILFEGSELISICGGDLYPCINDKEVSLWTSIKINKNDILSFKSIRSGSRAYISFAGGIDISNVLNSYSTNLNANLGGFEGRSLQTNDELTILTDSKNLNIFINNTVPFQYIPYYSNNVKIKTLLGPQDDYFNENEIYKFFTETYEISPMCNRMGFRLKGNALIHNKSANIISDGTNIGSIQVPGDGLPLILMNDCGTTGGYPKIGSVIFSDLDKVSQLKTGDKIKFVNVTLSEAHSYYREYILQLNKIKNILLNKKNTVSIYNVKINNKTYDVTIEENLT